MGSRPNMLSWRSASAWCGKQTSTNGSLKAKNMRLPRDRKASRTCCLSANSILKCLFWNLLSRENDAFLSARAASRALSDSRDSLPGQLRVPWVRVDHMKISEHVKKSIFSKKLRISELCNTTILALEKIRSGYLGVWAGRRYRPSDTVEIDELENPNSLQSVRSRDLLLRVASFWSDFDQRFRKAGWGESVVAIDYSRLLAKFSSQYFSLGGCAPGQGLSRGDVVDARLEWIDLPAAEEPIPLEDLSPRLKQ